MEQSPKKKKKMRQEKQRTPRVLMGISKDDRLMQLLEDHLDILAKEIARTEVEWLTLANAMQSEYTKKDNLQAPVNRTEQPTHVLKSAEEINAVPLNKDDLIVQPCKSTGQDDVEYDSDD